MVGQSEAVSRDKPPYAVPSMADIAALEPNGYNLISTFSGCGGSCLGFRMAGFRPLWASEFVPAAQDVYRLNNPDTPLDTRDIREVAAQEILDTIGLERGEIDVLEGSPPCASFSMAGKRADGWGKVREYSDTKQRADDLFDEFIRLVDGIRPRVFVAENVAGLVRGAAKGYFKEIMRALKACGYRVEARLLDAQWLGVPQRRQRLIIVGVRDDLSAAPALPKPLLYRYSVADALPWIAKVEGATGFDGHAYTDASQPASAVLASRPLHVEAEADISRYEIGREWLRLKPGQQSKRYRDLIRPNAAEPSPTVLARGARAGIASVTHPTERRKFAIAELKRICGFPDDFQITGTYAQQWERLGRAVPPVMMFHIAATVRDNILGVIDGRQRA